MNPTLAATSNDPAIGILIAILLPIYGVALFAFILFFLSRNSGWSRLAAQFATTREATGTLHTGCSITGLPPLPHGPFDRASRISYSSCIHATATPEGLYLRPNVLFQFCHPRLLIPWECVGPPTTSGTVVRTGTVPIATAGVHWNLHLASRALRDVEQFLSAANMPGSPTSPPAPIPIPPYRHHIDHA